MYIVEFMTKTGPVCESHATYDEALQRVSRFPVDSLVGLPLIFEELPDGSQRLVRDDGKPLQWHRLPEDRLAGPEEPLPLSEESLAPLDLTGQPPVCDFPEIDEEDLHGP